MRHYQALLRLDTSNPRGNEGLVVDYLAGVLQRGGGHLYGRGARDDRTI